MALRCDIFCAVIDNLGDVGVCWRLAQQLRREHEWQVRLWLDHLPPLRQLVPSTDIEAKEQRLADIEICQWDVSDFPMAVPADVVIEAFACELPQTYVASMAAQESKPCWINLEYLSLETWASACHGLPSPHPHHSGLVKYFFFPGIQHGTGGVLCERDLLSQRKAFDAAAFRQNFPAEANALWISLFCYENTLLPALLRQWVADSRPVNCLVTSGKAMIQVARWLGEAFGSGSRCMRGNLRLHGLPFLPQAEFDDLLWSCDLNFVRGEDSFVRAQWAALPFIWHIYPQEENAHFAKLAAFLERYVRAGTPESGHALQKFSGLWNSEESASESALVDAWRQLRAALPALHSTAAHWRQELSSLGNLAENLANFVKKH